jgi:CRISPR-associated endonuclease/helicase Cas3
MSRALTRSERLDEMKALYFVRGYRDSEMAERLGIDRTTVFRDRRTLEQEHVFNQEEDGRWRLDRTQYLSNIKVNLAEALTLYLAARRMSQQTRVAHIPVANALEKLALTLRQPLTTRLVAAADRILAQRQDSTRTMVFATVAQAWIENRYVRLHYRAFGHTGEKTHRFAPYLLEPSPWNDGIYLIGQSDLAHKPLTLKLDRIVRATLLGPFDLPEDFDEAQLLRHAWGIWWGEGEPETVCLKFAPGPATRRLKESIWHPLEQVTDDPDGGARWQAPIADWQEMLPWIRGWGTGVEVLAPLALRETVMGEARALAMMYGWNMTSNPGAHPSIADTFAEIFGKETGESS